MPNNKLCVTFAGAVGSSKTPIANYLSTKLNLPVFNNDAIRTEVIEDLGGFDEDAHKARRNERLKGILESGTSFICDVSVDREWEVFKKNLEASGYKWFIISLDLSKDLLVRLYKAKGYFESLERVDQLFNDHEIFLNNFSGDVGLKISDPEFKERLEISFDKTKNLMKDHED